MHRSFFTVSLRLTSRLIKVSGTGKLLGDSPFDFCFVLWFFISQLNISCFYFFLYCIPLLKILK